MNKKITLPELIDNLATVTGQSKKICESFIKDLVTTLHDSLTADEVVKITGLGIFKCVEVDARKSIDVNTGEEIEIPKYKKITLTVDKSLAQAVNSAFANFETVELDDDITEAMLTETPESEKIPESSETSEITEDSEVTQASENSEVTQAPENSDGLDCSHDSEHNEGGETSSHVSETTDTPSADQPQAEVTVMPEKHSTISNQPLYICTETPKRRFSHGLIYGFIFGAVAATIIGFICFKLIFHNIDVETPSDLQEVATITEEQITNIPQVDSIATNEEITDESPSTTVRTDTVGRTRFLTTMAREYFGNFNFWVYIYMENKDIIDNPNRIAPGTVVIIPDADKYGIDKNSHESVAKAQTIAAEIKNKYD